MQLTTFNHRDYRDSVVLANNIADVISEFITIQKAGGQKYKAKCPFHNDTDPSFSIDAGKGVYYCFGCGVGGGVIDFVMGIKRCDYGGALDWLAERAGVPIPQIYETSDRSDRVRDTLSELAKYFHSECRKSSEAMGYFQSRAIGSKAIAELKLGYTGHSIPPVASQDKLEALGIIKTLSSSVSFYWENTVTFPFWMSGKCVYITSRAIDDSNGKHKHLSKKMVDKDYLYNEQALRTGEGLIIVESPMCAASIVEHTNLRPVATLGATGFTEKDMFKIRFKPGTQRIVMCLDCYDKAGENATYRIGRMLMEEGHKVAVITLPSGIKDPNEFFKAGGPGDVFESYYSDAQDFIGWTLKHKILYDKEKIKRDPFWRAEIIYRSDYVLSCVRYLPPHVQEVYLETIAKELEVSSESLKNKLILDTITRNNEDKKY